MKINQTKTESSLKAICSRR